MVFIGGVSFDFSATDVIRISLFREEFESAQVELLSVMYWDVMDI